MEIVDARGKASPQPAILTRNALSEADELLVIIDDETARANITRMAEKMGCRVQAETKESTIELHIVRSGARSAGSRPASAKSTVVLVDGESFARGSAELNDILIRDFFHALNEVHPLPTTVVFIHGGVKWVTEGAAILDDLRLLRDKGVEILACGTCLKYFGWTDNVKVAQVSNMHTIAETLLRADHSISI